MRRSILALAAFAALVAAPAQAQFTITAADGKVLSASHLVRGAGGPAAEPGAGAETATRRLTVVR